MPAKQAVPSSRYKSVSPLSTYISVRWILFRFNNAMQCTSNFKNSKLATVEWTQCGQELKSSYQCSKEMIKKSKLSNTNLNNYLH